MINNFLKDHDRLGSCHIREVSFNYKEVQNEIRLDIAGSFTLLQGLQERVLLPDL